VKQILATGALIIFAVSCDSPTRTRVGSTYLTAENLSNPTTTTSGTTNSGTTTSGTTPTTGTTTNGSNLVTSVAGFENCDFSTKYYTVDVGHFALCQSTQDETTIKFQTSIASTAARICIIPTYKDTTGSSVYVGQPQCTYTQSNVAVTGKLYKNRSGYEGYAINGAMVMREGLLTPYYTCMNALVTYRSAACPYGYQQNANCYNAAQSYMTATCTQFKSTYQNSYADIRLK